jgi:hypothetical protein
MVFSRNRAFNRISWLVLLDITFAGACFSQFKWELVPPPPEGNPNLSYGVFADGQFVAVGPNGTICTSVDGLKWTRQNSGTTAHLENIFFTDIIFAVTGVHDSLLTSPDGITWAKQYDPIPPDVFGNGVWVAATGEKPFQPPASHSMVW